MKEQDLQIAVAESRALSIQTEEDYRTAEAYLKVISDLIKDVKEWFKPQKQKIDAAKKEILDKEREALAPLEGEKGSLRAKMSEWYAQQEEERKKATEALLASAPDPSLVEVPKLRLKTQKQMWKFRVVDFAALPDEYKAVDEKAIRSVVTAKKERAEIPGVEVYSEYVTVTR